MANYLRSELRNTQRQYTLRWYTNPYPLLYHLQIDQRPENRCQKESCKNTPRATIVKNVLYIYIMICSDDSLIRNTKLQKYPYCEVSQHKLNKL